MPMLPRFLAIQRRVQSRDATNGRRVRSRDATNGRRVQSRDATNGRRVRSRDATRFQRRAFTILDFPWWLFIIALLISILLPSLSRARELAKRAVCAANQRGIGQACHIYANDNAEWFPAHYFDAKKDATGVPADHGVSWAGAMGTSDELSITQDTTPKLSPKRGHPSRSLFLLVIHGNFFPKPFICPSSGDMEDNLRNSGADAGGAAETDRACQPGINRFDFRGYDNLSYGYQLPFGPKAKPRVALDMRMAIAADKGPYYESAPGKAGTNTTRDARSKVSPPAEWAAQDADALGKYEASRWRPYNSRNHNQEGQNVMFVDGHVDFNKKPIVGFKNDNIYTLQDGDKPGNVMVGKMPDANQTLGPGVDTDSFIVP